MRTVTASAAVKAIFGTDGHFFSVDFVKRSTGELRTLRGRQGVTKYLKGGDAPYSFSEKKLISVFDIDKMDYRSIPIEGIRQVRVNGEVLNVAESLEVGTTKQAAKV